MSILSDALLQKTHDFRNMLIYTLEGNILTLYFPLHWDTFWFDTETVAASAIISSVMSGFSIIRVKHEPWVTFCPAFLNCRCHDSKNRVLIVKLTTHNVYLYLTTVGVHCSNYSGLRPVFGLGCTRVHMAQQYASLAYSCSIDCESCWKLYWKSCELTFLLTKSTHGV